MSEPIYKRIPAHRDHNDNLVYWEPEIRAAATTVINLPGGLLAVAEGPGDGPWTHIALFQYAGGPATLGGVEVESPSYEHIMRGEGPAFVLRELRHTYWGEPTSGYIHSPNGELIIAALEALEKWFDLT